jgi:S1/P1 Nuclease
MRGWLAFGLAWAVVAVAPGQAPAWNSVGHLAVSKLAYDQMDDGVKVRLFAILKSHPHYSTFLAAGRPPEVEEAEWVILRASIWSDWIRPREKESRPDITKYHRGEEHYVNIPLIDPKDTDAFAGKTLINPDFTDILCSLKQRCNELRLRSASAEDRAVAACWIFHLIGDIHQPLHNVAYFSSNKAFEYGDQGGNKFGIKANGRGWKLHAFWDDVLAEDAKYTDDSPERQAKIYQQAVTIATNLRALKLPDADKEKLSKNRSFESWSRESFELARTVAYQKSDGSGILEGVEVKFNQPVPDNAPEVGEEYVQRAKATAEVRVVMAGQRLAERIKALLPK